MRENTPLFVLSHHWQEGADGIELRFWLKGGDFVDQWTVTAQESVCFVAKAQVSGWQRIWQQKRFSVRVGDREFTTLMGDQALPVYSRSVSDQRRWVKEGRNQGMAVWEDDVMPSSRYLMERFLFGSVQFIGGKPQPAHTQPQLNCLSIDIETEWYTPGKLPGLYSVALSTGQEKRVFIVDPGKGAEYSQTMPELIVVASVRACLQQTIEFIQRSDRIVSLAGTSLILTCEFCSSTAISRA